MYEKAMNIFIGICRLYFAWFKAIVLFFVPEQYRFKDVSTETVLITGGGSGIGQLLALNFAKLGSKVVIIDINENGLKETKKMVTNLNGTCHTYKCDLSNREEVYKTTEKIKSDVDFVSILINNAGMVSGKPILDLDDDKINQLYNVNVISHFWLVKSFLPDMMAKNHGHIVCISSMSGLVGNPYLTDYASSKFAALGFQESLWLETYFAGYKNINFTSVCPYYMNTGMFEGVQSNLLPMLDPQHSADKITSAIRCNQAVLLLPRALYFVYPLKTILPAECSLILDEIFDGHVAMKTFQGRTAKMNNNNNNQKTENNNLVNNLNKRTTRSTS